MRFAVRTIALAVTAWLALAPAAWAEVQLSIYNGRVTIVAKNATVRQILSEWARVGKTKIVNVERIPGGPISLELKDVPEGEALDVLLRSLSGYIAAPRTALVAADASLYDSIAVMPTVAAAVPRNSNSNGGPAPFSPPQAFNQQQEDDQDNIVAPVRPGGVAPQPGRPPIFQTFPAPQNGNGAARPMLPVVRPGAAGQQQFNNPVEREGVPPQAPASAQPTAAPGGFVGTSAPGMVPAAAAQPGQVQRPPSN